MPMIVVGADSPAGSGIVTAATARGGEVRAFVSDEAVAADFRGRSVKVALGDVSDTSHVGGAALGCFSAVLVAEAAFDGRVMSFAEGPEEAILGWVDAAIGAGVTRVVLVDGPHVPAAVRAIARAPESAVVAGTQMPMSEVVDAVLALDDASSV
jgi:putative NADH-flavin reductase